jgi:Domain of unknown function (DUF5916)
MVLIAGSAVTLAQESRETPPRPTVTAIRLNEDERITLDGRLDESPWQRAIPATDFKEQIPQNGAQPTERTEVRFLYTRDALYMGVTCFDDEPGKLLGNTMKRDEMLGADDRFIWIFDTFLDARNGYYFEMNPSGLMGDALRGANFQNRQWDGIWTGRVQRSDMGWTIEIEIPFSTLSFDPQAEAWGINFQRTVRRKNEESLWTGWLRNQGLNRLSNAGLLVGLEDISEGHGLDLKPYAIGTSESFPGRGNAAVRSRANAGLDVFYSPTPRLRTNVTLNTDFAQTEVDQRLTNLERFPQFFPEKRDFFLDGSTFFDFQSSANGDNTLLPFFTRRIGLNAGNPQKIDVGGKFAGQVGRSDVGAMYVRTGQEGNAVGEDFLIARVKHRMFRQSYVGALYTGRNVREAGVATASTAGADFLFGTSTFLGTQNFSVGGFFLNTTNARADGATNAYGVQIDYPNDPWGASLLYREVQTNYDAVVGFTPRTGYERIQPTVSYTQRPRQHAWIRSLQYGISGNFLRDPADRSLLNRDVDIIPVNISTHRQDSFQVHVLPQYERLERDFTINPGVTLPVGASYSWNRYRFQVSTAARRVIAVNPTYEVGTFYDGTRRRIATDVNIRVRPGVIVYTSTEWNEVKLVRGRFHTRLYRIVPELQFSPWMAWVNNIQYDTQSAVVGWQSRFRWILKPGNDLYVVYAQNWLDDPLQARTYTLDRRFATKFLYTRRF